MSFFAGMPQYYDMHDDPLNRNRPNPFNDLNKMHPGDARRFQAELSHAMDPGLQQGPRMYNPLIDNDRIQNDLNALNLDRVRDVYTPSDFVDMPPGNAAEFLMGQPMKQNMGMRRGETPDGAILKEIMLRRRGR